MRLRYARAASRDSGFRSTAVRTPAPQIGVLREKRRLRDHQMSKRPPGGRVGDRRAEQSGDEKDNATLDVDWMYAARLSAMYHYYDYDGQRENRSQDGVPCVLPIVDLGTACVASRARSSKSHRGDTEAVFASLHRVHFDEGDACPAVGAAYDGGVGARIERCLDRGVFAGRGQFEGTHRRER